MLRASYWLWEGGQFFLLFICSLLCLNQMLYALCLSLLYKEAVLFACLLSDWATTIGRLLGPKMRNSIKCLAQGRSDVLPHRESNQDY